jgi:hypothetical protein
VDKLIDALYERSQATATGGPTVMKIPLEPPVRAI